MNEGERLSALIGDIYDGALNPAQRTDVLDKVASFTGATRAAFSRNIP